MVYLWKKRLGTPENGKKSKKSKSMKELGKISRFK